jgi:hypothetical protein
MEQKNNSQTHADLPENKADETQNKKIEIGGRKGPEPTRFGDWELNGKCVDF